MSISPVNFNGLMQRTNDVSAVKANEDQHPIVEQQQIGAMQEKRIDEKMHRVNDAENRDETDTRHDAREEGRNKYFSTRDENKKREHTDKVVKKGESGGFDIRI